LIDIVIGTHRLLSKDVTFKNVGLIIIDEEHRVIDHHKVLRTGLATLDAHQLDRHAARVLRVIRLHQCVAVREADPCLVGSARYEHGRPVLFR